MTCVIQRISRASDVKRHVCPLKLQCHPERQIARTGPYEYTKMIRQKVLYVFIFIDQTNLHNSIFNLKHPRNASQSVVSVLSDMWSDDRGVFTVLQS